MIVTLPSTTVPSPDVDADAKRLSQEQERLLQEQENHALYNKLVEARQSLMKRQTEDSSSTSEGPASIGSKNTVVAVRVRPCLGEEVDNGEATAVFARPHKSGIVDAHQLRRSAVGKQPKLQTSTFKADRVYSPETMTEEIFDDIVEPLIPWVCNGGTATLLAHGQTGSGKTYTVSKLQKLISEAIFAEDTNSYRRICLSIIELAGNSAYDLINDSEPFSILEDAFGNTHLRGAREVPVFDTKKMVDYLEKASALRRTSATNKNNESSRSHAICRMQIFEEGSNIKGELYLIDLAGSEAARDTLAHGPQRLKETREINASLSTLNTCIRTKADADAGRKKNARVPFRQSALTRVLKHIFDPESNIECKMVVLACVNPCLEDVNPSKNTLRYAEDCRAMVTKKKALVYNHRVPTTWNNTQLKAWIRENAGTPPIDANLVAPFESGAQILALEADKFETRCLKAAGVTSTQARAVQSKLWLMHTDARQAADQKKHPRGTTSEDPNPRTRDTTFWRSRIRPGMVVQWSAPERFSLKQSDMDIAMILSDVSALNYSTEDYWGNRVNLRHHKHKKGTKYLCALVTPGHTMENPGYDVHMWQQFVVSTSDMMREVILTYDKEVRRYFIEN